MSARSTATLAPETLDQREPLKALMAFHRGDFPVRADGDRWKWIDFGAPGCMTKTVGLDQRHGKASRAGAAV